MRRAGPLGQPLRSRLGAWIAQRIASTGSVDADMLSRLFTEYFRRFRARFGLMLVMVAIVSLASAGIALLVKEFVNEVFVDKSGLLFVPLFVLVVVIFTSKGAATYYQSVLGARIANEIIADVRKRLYAHMVGQRMTFFSRYGSDEMQMRFAQGAEAFGAILTTVLVNATRDAATVVALLAVMVVQDALLTFGSLVVTPLILYGVVVLLNRIKGLAELEMEGISELYRRVRETVQGITVVKAYNLEEPARAATSEVIDRVRARADRIAVLQTATIPLLDVLGGVAVGLAILYAGFRTVTGDYDAGTFMAFLTALLLAADPARRLSQMRVQLRKSFALVKLVLDVLDEHEPEPTGRDLRRSPSSATSDHWVGDTPRIEFDKVGFAYADDSPVLDSFSLTMGPAGMTALVGPSGAGKSTVLRLLLRLYEPTAGAIRINGMDLREIDTGAWRESVAYVGQSNFLFDASVRDNLTLMNPDIPDAEIRRACALVGLDEHIAALPQGYETSVGELGALISGGQAQRLNFARAILKDAPVLLLDEVTSALDAENEHRIREVIREMETRKTIVVIAHRLSTVKDATRIALVRDGHVADIGTHEELITRSDYYRKVVELQFA